MLCRSIATARGLQTVVGVSQSSSSCSARGRSSAHLHSTRSDATQRLISPLRCFTSASIVRAEGSSAATEEQTRTSDAAAESGSAAPPPKPSVSGSYLDAIFDASNAFDRDDDIIQRRTSRTRSEDWVINSEKFRQHRADESELNQEWTTESKYPKTSRPGRGATGMSPHMRGGKSAMTPKEKSVYSAIFDDLFAFDTPYAGGASTDALLNSSLFGNFAGNKNEQKLHAFYRKSIIQRKQMREGIHPKVAPKTRFATGLMQELLNVDGVTEATVNEQLDVAKVQLQACESQNAVCDWADANIWPAKEHELENMMLASVDAAAAAKSNVKNSKSANATPSVVVERQFGMRTPLYAPVLFMMFKELRDRFRAPHAALAVLRNARNLGPESMVMGCTADLYAEAIRTSWYVLNDLQGACDLVREARDTGILSGDNSPYFTQKLAQDMGATARENSYNNLQDMSRIAKVVDSIKQDVRRTAFRAQQAMGMEVQSHLLSRQTAVAQEMMHIVAPVQPPQPIGGGELGGASYASRYRSPFGQYGDRDGGRQAESEWPARSTGPRTNFGPRPRLSTKPSISPRSPESMRSARPWHERHSGAVTGMSSSNDVL